MSCNGKVVLGILAVSVLIALVAGTSLAEVPKKINYQMRITDTDTGEPLPGSHNVVFRIFDSGLVGSSLWTEAHSVTADTAGVVSVILGSTTPIDISLDGRRWLEIEVDSETLSPRRELVSVPYALSSEHAANADSLGGMAATSFLTDGHSLDADDGNPVDVVYVHSSGRVGIGTTSPDYALHVRADQDFATEVVIENTHAGNQGWQGLTFLDETGFSIGIRAFEFDDPLYASQMRLFNERWEGGILFNTGGSDNVVIDHDGRLGINEENPTQKLHVNGAIQARSIYLGDSTHTGGIRVYKMGVDDPMVSIRADGIGGRIVLNDTAGNDFAELGSDGSAGGGGYFHVRRNTSELGFVVDGNHDGTESPRLSMTGTSFAYLDMSETDDKSVVLPNGSISSSETLDEPGVASQREHYTPATALSMVNGFSLLAFRTITVPADGYVLVLGSAQPTVTHTFGTPSQAEFGVSETTNSFPDNQDCMLMIDGGNPSGVYAFPITVHGLFEVSSAGTYTYNFVGRKYGGTFTGNDVQLTLVYFATNHGSVDPTFTDGGQAELSLENQGTVFSKTEEIAREREDAERAHRERVEQELAEMRAQIEALQREMETDPNSRPR